MSVTKSLINVTKMLTENVLHQTLQQIIQVLSVSVETSPFNNFSIRLT